MKKEIVGFFVCMLLVGTVLPVTGNISIKNTNKDTFLDSDDESGLFRWVFIFGPIGTMEYEDELLVIGATAETRGRLHYINPSLWGFWGELWLYQQIKIQFKFGILRDDFILGFAKIFVPDSEISMHIVSHNDLENNIVWEVDGIIGDPVWELNIWIQLLNDTGDLVHSYSYGPLWDEYLNIGDQIHIQVEEPAGDGYYRLVIKDHIFEDILFERNCVKF